jgi:NTP pyrophosphatase (non-canonical NTP hydrolase)
MDLADLIQQQIERDRHRGFPVDFDTDRERIDQLMRDLVGLVGEVGEFANLLKKIGLGQTTPGYAPRSLGDAGAELREELADAAIYLFRLATILGGNLEQDILRKIAINDQRYRGLGD